MKKINETKTLSDLLNSTLFSEKPMKEKMNTLIKHSTIFSFWNDVSGKKFASNTIPYAIKSSKLYISAKSPVIIQELTLYKKKLIEKINSYSMPLDIEIKDIVFDYKNYNEIIKQDSNEDLTEDKPIWYDDSKLNNKDESEEKLIKENIKKIAFLTEEQKEKLTRKAILSLRAKNLRKNK